RSAPRPASRHRGRRAPRRAGCADGRPSGGPIGPRGPAGLPRSGSRAPAPRPPQTLEAAGRRRDRVPSATPSPPARSSSPAAPVEASAPEAFGAPAAESASSSLAGLGDTALAAPAVSFTIGAGLSGSAPSGPGSSIQRTTWPSEYVWTTLNVTWGAFGSCFTVSVTSASAPLASAGPLSVTPPSLPGVTVQPVGPEASVT